MLGFEFPERLWLLLGLLPLLLLFAAAWWSRTRAWKRLGDPALLSSLHPARSYARKNFRFGMVLLALAGVVLALGNLRMGARKERVEREGADVLIAFDLSQSMLAEDMRPNRLDRAKFFASRLLRELDNDKVGLVVFAGNAYLQMPMTVDTRAAMMYLNVLNTDIVPRQGTAIGEAIATGMEAFEAGNPEGLGQPKNRALIIITDGENHEGEAVLRAEEAEKAGITVFTVGVGTPKGAPIPERRGQRADYKRDSDGNIVLTKLNETALQEIANAGGGKYYHLAGGNQAIRDLAGDIDRLGTATGDSFEYTEYRKHFQAFLAIALFLLMMEFILPDRRATWLRSLTNWVS